MRHGGWSERRIQPLAARLAEQLASAAPWTTRPAYAATVAAWSRAEARCQLIGGWLDEVGHLAEDGRPRPATNWLDKLEARASRLRAELGLTPMALARLLLATSELVRSVPDGVPSFDATLEALVREAQRTVEAGAGRSVTGGEGLSLGSGARTAEAAAGGAVVEGEEGS